jgi:hypothetical protein
MYCNGSSVQWDVIHQGSNPGIAFFGKLLHNKFIEAVAFRVVAALGPHTTPK